MAAMDGDPSIVRIGQKLNENALDILQRAQTAKDCREAIRDARIHVKDSRETKGIAEAITECEKKLSVIQNLETATSVRECSIAVQEAERLELHETVTAGRKKLSVLDALEQARNAHQCRSALQKNEQDAEHISQMP